MTGKSQFFDNQQIRSIQTPCKILTLDTEIKKSVGGNF